MTKYIVTFPVKYGPDWDHGQDRHPLFLDIDGRRDWAEIDAPDADTARQMAFDVFGQAWAFLYTDDDWMQELYPGRCAVRVDADGTHTLI